MTYNIILYSRWGMNIDLTLIADEVVMVK